MTGTVCSVASCKSNRERQKKEGKVTRFFTFPKNERIRKEWVRLCNKKANFDPLHKRVCSIHFELNQYEDLRQAQITNVQPKKLKKTAVPSLFLGKPAPNVKETSPAIPYSCVQEIGARSENIAEPEFVSIKGIDNLEWIIEEPLKSEQFDLVNSKRTPQLNLQKDAENARPLIDGSENYINSTANPEISLKMIKQEDSLKCRTCFEDIQMGYFLMNIAHATKTIKEMIVLCVPQMASTLSDEDIVCNKCLDAIQFCVRFIENCLEVEEKMRTFNREENGSACDQEDCNLPYNSDFAEIDHDYMIKSEAKEIGTGINLPPAQPSSEKNVLVNQIQEENSNVDETCMEPSRPLLKCPNCNRFFKLKKYLLNHIRSEHIDETRENVAGLGSRENANSQVGVVQKTDVGELKCWHCEKLFKTENFLLIHMRKVHNMPKVGVGMYVCKLCKRTFMRENSYKFHMKKHNQGVPNVCRVCGLSFNNKQALIEHRRQHGIICSICFKGFSSRAELNEHRETHPNIFSCKECGKGFKMKQSLIWHAQVHSPYCFYCSECGKGFKSNAALKYHQIIHDPDKKLKCDQCSSTFQDKRKLLLHHKIVHEKVKEYQCSRCGIQFGSMTLLKHHIRLTHLKLKSYQCEACGKRFGRRDYLRVHTNQHCKVNLTDGDESVERTLESPQ